MVEKLLFKLNTQGSRQKNGRYPSIFMLLAFLGTIGQMNAQNDAPFGETQESINYDFNQCRSFANDNSNYDYSEFVPNSLNSCAGVSAGHLYRDSGKHSCTDDEQGNAGYAACFQSSRDNQYSPNNTLAIRFDVQVSGDNGKNARLDGISFKQLAPLNYLWTSPLTTNENTGPNDYPTKFGVRVLKDGKEVYRKGNLATAQSWETSSFNFIENEEFVVAAGTSSQFTFELFSYAPVGNGAAVSAWDLDDLKVFSSCQTDCDITIEAGEDVSECTEENIELTATYNSNNECVSGCEYPVLDTQKCGGSSEEVYLFISEQHNVSERRFEATAQNFQTFSDGTARYTATATNGHDVVEVNMLYSGRTSNAPTNSPKTHSCGANQDLFNFDYYPTLNGTIVSQNHGTFYATSMGPSFQIGLGGDVERTGFGASGWFNLSGGDGYYDRGDVNIALGECIEQGTVEATFLWSTANGTIVGDATQQTIEVSKSGIYTVTVTSCNGCEATDVVEVSISEKLIVGDFVWEDLNRNGLQDANEPGVDGMSVALYNEDGTLVADTTTANGGAYSFEVCPGEYYVVFGGVPNGFELTTPNSGDDALDSDANENGRTPNFVLTNSNNPTIDAGIVALCNLNPTVSGDEEVCSGEEAMLTATGGNTYLWSTGETTASVKVNPTATTTYTVTVSDNAIADCEETLEFTVNITEKLVVGDIVFEDVNRNGLQDDNEPGVDAVSVTLYNADGTVAQSTTTANGGKYSFEVCPGEYYIVFGDVPADFDFTNADAGDDALDSDADSNGQTPNFVITDSDNTTIDAGLVKLCTIDPTVDGDKEVCAGEEAMLTATGGDTFLWSTGETTASIKVNPTATTVYTVVVSDSTIPDCSEELLFTVNVTEKLVVGDIVFEDVNRNGLQDANEPGVDGMSVTLYNADGSVAQSTITANGGEYSFEVCPGEYYIVFGNVPADFDFTNADAGDDALDSDADSNGQTPNFVITDSDNTTIDAGLVKLCTIDPTVDGDKEICAGEETILMATGGDTYLWSTGKTTASIKVSPKATTTYTVVVSDSTIPDCSVELSFTVTVQSVNIDAGPDVSIAFGDSTTLTVGGADASDQILWSTGETTDSILVSPESQTTYSVTVVNSFGCMDEDSVTVDVLNACGMEPSFKILPRDEAGVYTPGYETAACIGDNFYLWMFDAEIDVLNDFNGQDYTQWSFTYEYPNGEVVVQNNRPNYPGNHRFEVLDLGTEDFGDYKISWISPSGCAGSTVFTLNFPDAGCGDNGTRVSDFYTVDAVYPIPAAGGSEITLEISTKTQGFSSLSGKGATTSGKSPELVSRKETIKLSLYNMSGRLMASARSYDVEQGKVKVYYQLGNLPTGNYIIKVDGANWTDSKQIMIE